MSFTFHLPTHNQLNERLSMNFPSDSSAPKFPVSIKMVVKMGQKIPLLKNERDEWELPGGKLEYGEDPQFTAVREVDEELGIDVAAQGILSCWTLNIQNKVEVLIVSYYCSYAGDASDLRISHEHKELKVFDLSEIKHLHMPDGYKNDIYSAYGMVD